MGWYRLEGTGSGYGPVKGSCEHGDEPSGSGRAQLRKKK
jgi:hypothetical protein